MAQSLRTIHGQLGQMIWRGHVRPGIGGVDACAMGLGSKARPAAARPATAEPCEAVTSWDALLWKVFFFNTQKKKRLVTQDLGVLVPSMRHKVAQ